MDQFAIMVLIVIIAAVVGALMEKAAVHLIKSRVKTLMSPQCSGSFSKTLFWAMVNASIWLILIKLNGLESKTLEVMMLVSVGIMLAVIDVSIKKIPNELVLMTIFIGGAFLITGQPFTNLGMHVLGLVIGFFIFLLPAMIGKGAGWGDVKYAAAVGFCLGVDGMIAAVFIMTFFLMIYSGYLMASKKGGLKSRVALGPFMAAGFVAVLFLNLLNINNQLFEWGMLL